MIYFGHGRNGIEEAAQFYFGIPASKLNLAQPVIAGLIQSPEKLRQKAPGIVEKTANLCLETNG